MTVDIEERQEVEEDSITSLIAMDQSVSDSSKEESGMTGKIIS